MKTTLAIISSTVLLIPIWGFTLLSATNANETTVFICFAITLLLYIPFRKSQKVYLLLIGPMLYALLILIFNGFKQLDNPIFILLISLTLLLLKFLNAIRFVVFTVIAILYSFFIYPDLKYGVQITNRGDYIHNPQILEVNLFQFSHLKHLQGKTKEVRSHYLIETWNEACSPCLKSITELEDSIRNFKHLHHVYLYQDLGQRRLSAKEILNFEKIQNKAKIEIDSNNLLYRKMNLGSMPYFIIFDSSGKYVDHWKGYSSDLRNELLEFLKGKQVED